MFLPQSVFSKHELRIEFFFFNFQFSFGRTGGQSRSRCRSRCRSHCRSHCHSHCRSRWCSAAAPTAAPAGAIGDHTKLLLTFAPFRFSPRISASKCSTACEPLLQGRRRERSGVRLGLVDDAAGSHCSRVKSRPHLQQVRDCVNEALPILFLRGFCCRVPRLHGKKHRIRATSPHIGIGGVLVCIELCQ